MPTWAGIHEFKSKPEKRWFITRQNGGACGSVVIQTKNIHAAVGSDGPESKLQSKKKGTNSTQASQLALTQREHNGTRKAKGEPYETESNCGSMLFGHPW